MTKWTTADKDRIRVYRRANKERVNELARARRKKNPALFQNQQLKSRYGITLAQFDKMLIDQLGLCKICREPTPKITVDHKHDVSEKVRGLLCSSCQIYVACIENRPELLEKVKRYVLNDGAI